MELLIPLQVFGSRTLGTSGGYCPQLKLENTFCKFTRTRKKIWCYFTVSQY